MIKRGELYYADLSPVIGSEQGGVRPVLIIFLSNTLALHLGIFTISPRCIFLPK